MKKIVELYFDNVFRDRLKHFPSLKGKLDDDGFLFNGIFNHCSNYAKIEIENDDYTAWLNEQTFDQKYVNEESILDDFDSVIDWLDAKGKTYKLVYNDSAYDIDLIAMNLLSEQREVNSDGRYVVANDFGYFKKGTDIVSAYVFLKYFCKERFTK